MPDVLHVVPQHDLVGHDTATSEPDCVCGPAVEPVEREEGSYGWLLIHHSLDGRENTEAENGQ